MEGIFFEVHGSKFKPDPLADLGKTSDEGVAHPMLLFRISETLLDRFFSLVIEFCVLPVLLWAVSNLVQVTP